MLINAIRCNSGYNRR